MKLKPKPVKRTTPAPQRRSSAPATVARKVRGQDLGELRLQLLLGAVR